ncbi:hypothetical protein QMO56_06855 [Roseomonas sp. E05]|uniref:hypothetical protein n=1 Tax=Roseomonas sp. E05 TaxID=3046310 RepID=UPI0024B8918A|nr:hypothetical protein [Roseomonas sp. E05]MDJ0387828.1 hypothetical protein [Roseomonas sp. E05]
MFRKAILSTVLAFGVIGAAAAQESSIRVLGTGENFAVDYSNDGGNIVGGGPVKVIGRNENARYIYAPDSPAQHGLVASFANQGENNEIIYTPAPSADTAGNPQG